VVSIISGAGAAICREVVLGISVHNFTQQGGCAVFLCSFICSRVSGLMQFSDRPDKGIASNSV
jgi:small neutral amino acid transporter SnatA (MarC family)